ncbi:MAG TPA: BlaI/MecI/CopY family transcriptional regulator, partial [Gemmatimonadaceae bacterium]|nr:BlaI/MecI/CopY family transcriptional regulator [Gemmatimonadaceae bacterium]
MAHEDELEGLSRRERQIMDFLFQRGKASVGEVLEGIPNPPGYSAVRATLRTLEQKGRVMHEEDGRAYVYRPTLRRDAARRTALTHVLRTFFDNSAE